MIIRKRIFGKLANLNYLINYERYKINIEYLITMKSERKVRKRKIDFG